jgi:hypothetical protein
MAYQLEKKALNKVKTLSATDYIALIRNVENQKNAGNVLITWSDLLVEVGMDLTYINNLSIGSTIAVNSITEYTQGNGIQFEKIVRYTESQQFLSGLVGAVSPARQTTVVDTTAGAAVYTLADGLVGQEKFIYMAVDNGTATITPTNLLGWTSIDLTQVGDSVTLWFNGISWVIKATGGLTTLIP